MVGQGETVGVEELAVDAVDIVVGHGGLGKDGQAVTRAGGLWKTTAVHHATFVDIVDADYGTGRRGWDRRC